MTHHDLVYRLGRQGLPPAEPPAPTTPAGEAPHGFNEPEPHVPQYPFPTRKFRIGDRVRKTKGSQWRGRVCGFYQTTLTPEGYAVESEREPGSVQIYPVAALELVEERSET
jgi:hypothetical protein